jgi:F0F1-type ATP synthase delta subunit
MKNGEIFKICDFEYDKNTKNMHNLRTNIFEEKVKEETIKDILGSKWEKYVNNVIKSVVKEEI